MNEKTFKEPVSDESVEGARLSLANRLCGKTEVSDGKKDGEKAEVVNDESLEASRLDFAKKMRSENPENIED